MFCISNLLDSYSADVHNRTDNPYNTQADRNNMFSAEKWPDQVHSFLKPSVTEMAPQPPHLSPTPEYPLRPALPLSYILSTWRYLCLFVCIWGFGSAERLGFFSVVFFFAHVICISPVVLVKAQASGALPGNEENNAAAQRPARGECWKRTLLPSRVFTAAGVRAGADGRRTREKRTDRQSNRQTEERGTSCLSDSPCMCMFFWFR